MKSMLKSKAESCGCGQPKRREEPVKTTAQCCAKIARTVAGCHD